jgi:hypothetical protein
MLKDKQLVELEELAKLPNFTIRKIALVLKVPEDWLKDEISKDSPVSDAYHRGKLANEVEFNKKVNMLSNQGSGPAQTLMDKMRKDAEFQELRNHYK